MAASLTSGLGPHSQLCARALITIQTTEKPCWVGMAALTPWYTHFGAEEAPRIEGECGGAACNLRIQEAEAGRFLGVQPWLYNEFKAGLNCLVSPHLTKSKTKKKANEGHMDS